MTDYCGICGKWFLQGEVVISIVANNFNIPNKKTTIITVHYNCATTDPRGFIPYCYKEIYNEYIETLPPIEKKKYY